MQVFRRSYRTLWRAPRRSVAEAVRHQAVAYQRAVLLVRAFYGAGVYWVIAESHLWRSWLEADEIVPQAPAWWVDVVGADVGVPMVLAGYALAALVATALPERRGARLAYAVAFLQYSSVVNGFGKIGAGQTLWIFASAILVLLPGRPWHRRNRIAERRSFLTVVWFVQLSVLFGYTLTGYWKVTAALLALVGDEVSAFNPGAFSIILAETIAARGREPLLSRFLIDRELLGWALFNATMYLELTSVVVAFRPRLHRVWGILLVIFHVSTNLTMDVVFPFNGLLLGIVLVCSPFTPERVDLRQLPGDLPGVPLALGAWRWMRSLGRRGAGPAPPAQGAEREPVAVP